MKYPIIVMDEESQLFYDENQNYVDRFHNSQVLLDDVNLSAFFLKELVSVETRTYDVKFKKYKYADLIPIDTSDDPGAKTIAYQRYTKRGRAKIIASYAMDAPRVDVFGEEIYIKVYQVCNSFGYSREDIRNARMAGKPLDTKRAETAKDAMEAEFNDLAFSGDADYNIAGFIDYPGTNEYITPDGTSGEPEFIDKTPFEVLTDLNGIVTAVIDVTNGVEEPDTLLLPIAQFEYIKSTPMSDIADKSILKWFLENNVHIKTIDWLTELKGAGAGGSDRMICYKRDRNNLCFKIPLAYTQLPPEVKGYTFVINTEAKCAGTVIYYPLSVAIADNI